MSIPNPRTLVRDLAAAITAKDYFARDDGGMLYVYRDGVYQPSGELWIRRQVKHLLLDHDCQEMRSRALSKEVVDFVALDVPDLPTRPSAELINPKMGYFELERASCCRTRISGCLPFAFRSDSTQMRSVPKSTDLSATDPVGLGDSW